MTSPFRAARIQAMHRFPTAYIQLSRHYNRHFRWQNERAYLNGSTNTPAGAPQSIVFLTYHRSGSTLVTRMLREAALLCEMQPLDLRGYIVSSDPDRLAELTNGTFWPDNLSTTGYLFAPVRQPVEIPTGLRSLALIRDPRDSLVSHYYSVLHAHTLLNERTLERHQAASRLGIDGFVLDMVDRYTSDLGGIVSSFLSVAESDRLLLSYDDLLTNQDAWLVELCSFMGVAPTKLRAALGDDGVSTKETTDLRSHNRSGASGQFVEELQPATIAAIESKVLPVLAPLGLSYELTQS